MTVRRPLVLVSGGTQELPAGDTVLAGPMRVTSIASSATPTFNTDTCDMVSITALAAAITSMTSGRSGTPTDGQPLWFRIKDNGSARAITWGADFESVAGVALPATTVISKRLTVAFMYDIVALKFSMVGVIQES